MQNMEVFNKALEIVKSNISLSYNDFNDQLNTDFQKSSDELFYSYLISKAYLIILEKFVLSLSFLLDISDKDIDKIFNNLVDEAEKLVSAALENLKDK